MNIRKELAQKIKASVPAGWSVFAYGVSPDNPSKPVVIVRQLKVAKTPAVPKAFRDTDFTVALVEPGLDPSKVEDALDDDVETLIDILESIDMPGLTWQEAQRVTFEDRFHGYDLTITITNTKEA